MNKAVKAKWLAALKSGDYKQGQLALRWDGQHCCLGVLCDIYAKDVEDLWHPGNNRSADFFDDQLSLLPDKVLNWAGLVERHVLLGRSDAVTLNDRGVSFARIADLIEKLL